MRVCFIAGKEPSYARNAVILRALEIAGFDVRCVTSEASTYALRLPLVNARMLWNKIIGKNGEPDVYLVGFLGHPLVLLLRRITRRPIVFDPFVSLYDTLCNDRMRFRPGTFPASFFHLVDRKAFESADINLADTQEHIRYFTAVFSQPSAKFVRLWVGADDRLYYPRKVKENVKNGPVEVLYYATFQPLHGVDVVLDAVEMLEHRRDIRFHLIGRGPELSRLEGRIKEALRKGNLTWRPWVEEKDLPRIIASSDICLGGHFSDKPKAKRTIPGKLYQFMAMRKAIIAGDSPANRELLTRGRDALFVPMGDARALAQAIIELSENPGKREEMAENAYLLFKRECSPAVLADTLGELLEKAYAQKSSHSSG